MKSRLVGLVAALTLAVAGGAVGFTQLAFAGTSPAAPLTIVKVVDGPVPAGTTFEVTVHCDKAIIDLGGGEGTDTATVTFDENGQPTSADVIGFGDPGTCTVTETGTGGAATVAYACEGVVGTNGDGGPPATGSSSFGDPSSTVVIPEPLPVCATNGPVDPITVNISQADQSGTVTVTNTFTEPQPQPAAEVVAAPAFTG